MKMRAPKRQLFLTKLANADPFKCSWAKIKW